MVRVGQAHARALSGGSGANLTRGNAIQSASLRTPANNQPGTSPAGVPPWFDARGVQDTFALNEIGGEHCSDEPVASNLCDANDKT